MSHKLLWKLFLTLVLSFTKQEKQMNRMHLTAWANDRRKWQTINLCSEPKGLLRTQMRSSRPPGLSARIILLT